MNTPKEVVVIGNVQADLLLGPLEHWPERGTETQLSMADWRPGGSAGNSGLALHGLGVPCRLLATVGDDGIGSWLQECFGFSSADLTVERGTATTITVGLTHPDGERTFLTGPGHLQRLHLQALVSKVPTVPSGEGLALLSGIYLGEDAIAECYDILTELHNRGYRVAIDPGWPSGGWTAALRKTTLDWFTCSDHILVNDKELLALMEESRLETAFDRLHRELPASTCLVVKRGRQGAVARRAATRAIAPAPHVRVIDTVGAGDCFNSGYLTALQHGWPLAERLRLGVEVASRAISTRPRQYCGKKRKHESI